jgi:uncharacterized ferritin-like protein (DUF455 family)
MALQPTHLLADTAPPQPSDLRAAALYALQGTDIERKVALTLYLSAQAATDFISNQTLLEPANLPGRPLKPCLIAPAKVPRRSPHSATGLAALLHAIAHIEFNAINLALDAVWRFAEMPDTYYRDWLKVAAEEAHHFSLLRAHLQDLGHDYGDFPAHDGLWQMVEKTKHDITARMALVPRTLEARGLDATPLIQAKLRAVGTPHALRAVDTLQIILSDEIGHVAIGNHWYRWLCARGALEPVTHYRALVTQHNAPRLHAPFNEAARRQAGFTDDELAALLA